MTQPTKTEENFEEGEQMDFFFWLGEEGLRSLTKEEMDAEQQATAERYRRWKDVDVLTDEGTRD